MRHLLSVFLILILCQLQLSAQLQDSLISKFNQRGGEEVEMEKKISDYLREVKRLYAEEQDVDAAFAFLEGKDRNLIIGKPANRKAKKVMAQHASDYYRWKTVLQFERKERLQATENLEVLMNINNYFVFTDFEDPDNVALEDWFDEFVARKNKGIVFVNKHGARTETVPSVLTVYKREDIDRLGARNLLDLLRLTPGYAELGDNNERNFGTRGVGGTTVQHVLFLLNGHRLNDLLTGTTGPDWISLDYVQQIEIITGPGSALYGGNAFSGVVNIITKTGLTYAGSEINLDVGTGVFDTDNFNAIDHTYKLNFQTGRKIGTQGGLYVSGTMFMSGGSRIDPATNQIGNQIDILGDSSSIYYGTHNSIIPNGEAHESSHEFINRYRPSYNIVGNYINKSFNLVVNAQSNVLELSRPGSHNLWDFDSLVGSNRDLRRRVDSREFMELSFNPFSNGGMDSSSLTIKGSFDHFKKDLFINSYSDPYFLNYEDDDVDYSFYQLAGDEFRLTGAIEFSTQKLKFTQREKSFTLFGGSFTANYWDYDYYTPAAVAEDIDGDGVMDTTIKLTHTPGVDFFTNYSDGKPVFSEERTFALYGQTEKHLIIDKLILTAGISLNYHPVFANFTGDSLQKADGSKIGTSKLDWGNGLSPKVALVYTPQFLGSNFFNGKLLFNSAFVPPAFLYRNGGIKNFTGSTHIASQSMSSFDLSLFGDTRVWDDEDQEFKRRDEKDAVFGYQLNAYYNVLDDFIARQSDGTYDNVSDEDRFVGFELSAFIEKNGFKLFTTMSRTDLLDDEVLYYYPGYIQTGGIQYVIEELGQMKKGSVYFNVNFNFIRDIHVVFNNFPDVDNTLTEWDDNPYTTYTPPIFNLNTHYANDKFDIGLNVHNLLNTNYHLPSRISPLRVMRGEKLMALIQLKFKIGGDKE
jgi:outer membrane receptor protein involved in Fe transport